MLVNLSHRDQNAGSFFIACLATTKEFPLVITDILINPFRFGSVKSSSSLSRKPRYPEKKDPPSDRKIFVGGVGQETTEEDVRAYFERFGRVESAILLSRFESNRNRSDRGHRGFGFVTFVSAAVAREVYCSFRSEFDIPWQQRMYVQF